MFTLMSIARSAAHMPAENAQESYALQFYGAIYIYSEGAQNRSGSPILGYILVGRGFDV